ncbi:MAG: tetratricopeptide repeat protein [Alphaproteobacteria bacterium]
MKIGVKAAVCAALLWLCLAAPAAYAGAMEDGLAAYEQKDYATALRFWRPLAEQRNADAQINLAFMYQQGQGVPQDDAQALAWLHKAIEQGNAEAQYILGMMYQQGQGVPQDYVQALAWLGKAAE